MPSTCQKCCCCIDLRIGCLIIGYLQLVALFFVSFVVMILVLGGGLASASNNSKDHVWGVVMFSMAAVLGLVLMLCLVFVILLLVGLHKDKKSYVKTYIIFAYVSLVFGSISIVAEVYALETINLTNISNYIVNVYFLLVIRSYYKQMGDSAEGANVVFDAKKSMA